ncbi:VTT domain-containing protein [Candidatus Wolfebacteria bacterium]|nr:VTT domain-containing protein [Candidatus Wolfebacteria bacterium]
METFLLNHSNLWENIGYWIAFFGIMIEGDILIFVSFFLASQEYFKVGKLFFVLFLGTIIGDMIWYYFGSWANKFLLVAKLAKKIKIFDDHLIKRPFHTMVISKFAYGLHHLILMRAGALNFDFKKFVKYDFVSGAVWISSIGVLGYLSGASFLAIKKYLKFTEVGLLLAIFIFILAEYFIRRKSKEEL